MAAISQTTFWNIFLKKTVEFLLNLHWSLFLKVQLTATSIGLDNGLAPNRRQTIIWTNTDPILRRIYSALGGDDLIQFHAPPDDG